MREVFEGQKRFIPSRHAGHPHASKGWMGFSRSEGRSCNSRHPIIVLSIIATRAGFSSALDYLLKLSRKNHSGCLLRIRHAATRARVDDERLPWTAHADPTGRGIGQGVQRKEPASTEASPGHHPPRLLMPNGCFEVVQRVKRTEVRDIPSSWLRQRLTDDDCTFLCQSVDRIMQKQGLPGDPDEGSSKPAP